MRIVVCCSYRCYGDDDNGDDDDNRYAKSTIAVEIEAVNHKMTEMQRQLQEEEAKSRQADRLRTALAQREHELSELEARVRRENDQRDQVCTCRCF